MGDKPLAGTDWSNKLTINGDLSKQASEKLETEGIEVDQTKLIDALSKVREFYKKKENVSKRDNDSSDTIINKIVGNYKSSKGKKDEKKSSIPAAPLEFAKPFTDQEIKEGNIFYLIYNAAKRDIVKELLGAVSTKDYREEFKKRRTIRVPKEKNLKDNTKGVILPESKSAAPAPAAPEPAPASTTEAEPESESTSPPEPAPAAAPESTTEPESGSTSAPAAAPANLKIPLKPVDEDPNFFEPQEFPLSCGRHALNNLLGGRNFTKGDSSKAYDLEKPEMPVPLQEVCRLVEQAYIPGLECPENENYDTNVLQVGLRLFGFPVEQSTLKTWNEQKDHYGYIINFGGAHWVSLRKISDTSANGHVLYIYKDSLLPIHKTNPDIYTKESFEREYGQRIRQVLIVSVSKREDTQQQTEEQTQEQQTEEQTQEQQTEEQTQEQTQEEQKQADEVENAKLKLSFMINTFFKDVLDANTISNIIKISRNAEDTSDITSLTALLNSDLESKNTIEAKKRELANRFNSFSNDLQKLVDFDTLNRTKEIGDTTNLIYKSLLSKLNISTILNIYNDTYKVSASVSSGEKTYIERLKTFPDKTQSSTKGGGRNRGENRPQTNQQPRELPDLIDYAKAYALYGLSKSTLKKILNDSVTLTVEPGGKIENNKLSYIRKFDTEQTELTTNEKSLETLDTDIADAEKEIGTLNTKISTEKSDDEKKKLTKQKEDQEKLIKNKTKEKTALESKIVELTENIALKKDTAKRIFQSPKKTDNEIINSISSISAIGPAIERLVEKIKTVKGYIDQNPENPISLIDLKDIKQDLLNDIQKVNFNVTPLQYAVLVGNKQILETLITNNIQINSETIDTDPASDGTTYTLLELATKRSERDDPRRKEVIDFVTEIVKTVNKASSDFNRQPPRKDEEFLKNPRVEESITLIYKKVFQELLEGKSGPNADFIDIDIVRYADIIKQAKEDANKKDTKTKTQGIPNPDLYKPLAWKGQSPGLPAASAAYTKYYDIELAKIKGTQDGKLKLLDKTYDRSEYKIAPLFAVAQAYKTAYNIASATDYDRGFYDGLSAKAVSEYITGTGFWFLEPEYADALLETSDASIKKIGYPLHNLFKRPYDKTDTGLKVRDDYKLGYIEGIQQLLASDTPVDKTKPKTTITKGYYDTVKTAVERAAKIDAEKGYPMYTTPAEYIAADTREGKVFDSANKDILVQIFLNKLITTYVDFMKDRETSPKDLENLNEEQKKINDLKYLYDKTYQVETTKKLQSTPTQPSTPPIKPSSRPPPKGGTRKRTTKSPKRRTLRKK